MTVEKITKCRGTIKKKFYFYFLPDPQANPQPKAQQEIPGDIQLNIKNLESQSF